MKKTYIMIYGTVFFFLLSASWARAHLFWLNASQDAPQAGKAVRVKVGFGHKFPQDEQIKEERLGAVKALGTDGKEFPLKKNSLTQYEFVPPAPGVYLLSAQVVPGFVTRTPQGMKLGTKKGVPDANLCFHFDMAAKTILNVGGQKQGFNQSAGGALEILPLKNPASLKQGGSLPVKIIFQGKPQAGVEIKLTHDSWADSQKPFAVQGKTDAQGEIQVKLDKPGKWLIIATHKTPYPNPEECDENMYSATLTFTVR